MYLVGSNWNSHWYKCDFWTKFRKLTITQMPFKGYIIQFTEIRRAERRDRTPACPHPHSNGDLAETGDKKKSDYSRSASLKRG